MMHAICYLAWTLDRFSKAISNTNAAEQYRKSYAWSLIVMPFMIPVFVFVRPKFEATHRLVFILAFVIIGFILSYVLQSFVESKLKQHCTEFKSINRSKLIKLDIAVLSIVLILYVVSVLIAIAISKI